MPTNECINDETHHSFHLRVDVGPKRDCAPSTACSDIGARLVLSKQVALAKWDSRAPVEDPTREAQVITAAAKEGELKGLNRTFVSNFFAAQTEANKLVQYPLSAAWHPAGGAPKQRPISLTVDIRPRLDQIEAALIAELVD